jgi:hypothetical protein
MDMDDLTPENGGSLRDVPAAPLRQVAARFVHTPGTVHQDEASEHSGPAGRPWRADPQPGTKRTVSVPGPVHEEAGRTVRAALRPGG